MNWAQLTLSICFGLNALLTVLLVGRPRTPITPGIAATSVIGAALGIALVVMA